MLYSKFPDLPGPLPKRVRLQDGTTRTSLHELTEAELIVIGVYPVNEIRQTLGQNQDYGTPELSLANDVVTAVYPAIDLPLPQVTVSAWQIRKALNAAGLRAEVEAAVAASDDQDIKDGWEYAQSFDRTHQLVVAMASQLGLDDDDVTQIFSVASTM